MGCCMSRDGGRGAVKRRPLAAVKSSSPVKEVETVKEVLTLTPTHPTTKPAPETDVAEPDHASCVKAPELGRVAEYETSPVKPLAAEAKSFKLPPADEASDGSECYSYNESRSTTTVTEIRDDNDEGEGEVNTRELRQRMKTNRSPARYSNRGSTQQRLARPPNRPQRTRNGAVSSPKPRRDTTQSPARRPEFRPAESPVRRTASPAARHVNGPRPNRPGPLSPKRVDRPGPLSPKRVDYGGMEESLENPLVSLECFIFL